MPGLKDAACSPQRKEEASRLRSKAHQDAAQAEIAAAKAEASGAKAEVAAAEGKAATFASRLQELQDSADVASLVSVHMC